MRIRLCSYVVLWIMLTFPGGGFAMSRMLMSLPVTVATSPWDTLAYCVVSPSFCRCLGYQVRSIKYRVPLMIPGHSQTSPVEIFYRKGNMRGMSYGWVAFNRLKWLVHVLMLQWLWC